MHLKVRLLQIIDLAPIVLGIFSYLLGVSTDRRIESEKVALEAMSQKAQIQAELAQKLQLQNDELRELNATMDGLVYTASHDLKTPAVNFDSMLKMLRAVKDQPGSEQMVEEIISRMEAASRRFKTTISDLLEVSLVERQDANAATEISISKIIGEIKSALDAFIHDNQATIELDLQADEVMGTHVAITSVFQNLITNAIKYRHADRLPVVKISSKRIGSKVEVKVADNGSGIDLQRQGAKVFKMFSRFHSTGEGTGVGLYIVKRTLNRMGGDVGIESTPGIGTTFTIKMLAPEK